MSIWQQSGRTLYWLFDLSNPKESRSAKAAALALQLPFCFEVRALSDRLVSSTPE
jgi:hypothetical protein